MVSQLAYFTLKCFRTEIINLSHLYFDLICFSNYCMLRLSDSKTAFTYLTKLSPFVCIAHWSK